LRYKLETMREKRAALLPVAHSPVTPGVSSRGGVVGKRLVLAVMNMLGDRE
jgi:hypothetical protein